MRIEPKIPGSTYVEPRYALQRSKLEFQSPHYNHADEMIIKQRKELNGLYDLYAKSGTEARKVINKRLIVLEELLNI